MSSYALCLDTTGPTLILGLSNFDGAERYQSWELGRDLSAWLHHHLVEFLRPQLWTALSWIAVARGPGSFTGTRMGIVTVRTLAQQLELPLFAVSTLATLAWAYAVEQFQATPDPTLAVSMPGQQGSVHGGIYQLRLASSERQCHCLSPDQTLPEADWQHLLAAFPMAVSVSAATASISPEMRGRALLELAHQQWQQGDRPSWSTALPYYGASPVMLS